MLLAEIRRPFRRLTETNIINIALATKTNKHKLARMNYKIVVSL